MTKEQAAKYLADPTRCPFCGSEAVAVEAMHDGDTNAHQNFRGRCDECLETWVEVYKLESVFREEDDEDEEAP